MKRGALIASFIGGTTSIAIWVAYMQFGYLAGSEMVALWPNSIMLLGLEHSPSISFSFAVWLVSIFINIGLYGIIGLCVTALYRFVTNKIEY